MTVPRPQPGQRRSSPTVLKWSRAARFRLRWGACRFAACMSGAPTEQPSRAGRAQQSHNRDAAHDPREPTTLACCTVAGLGPDPIRDCRPVEGSAKIRRNSHEPPSPNHTTARTRNDTVSSTRSRTPPSASAAGLPARRSAAVRRWGHLAHRSGPPSVKPGLRQDLADLSGGAPGRRLPPPRRRCPGSLPPRVAAVGALGP